MLAIERRKLILEILQRDKQVLVTELCQQYNVSDETIRRDLRIMETEGTATRTYGGAVINESAELPYTVRKKTNVEAKETIARNVALLIEDGDFIMLDESSTSTFVARAIKKKKNITLITNSIEIILEVSEIQGWNIFLIGGALKSTALALTGHQAERFIRSYHVNKAVLSCTGLDPVSGYTDAGEDNALIKRAMMESADQTILAVDSEKFDKKAFSHIGDIQSLSAIVTDHKPSQIWCDTLAENNVRLIYDEGTADE